MTRKDYETIAAAVNSARLTMGVRYMLNAEKADAASETTFRIVRDIATVLEQNNPRFDRQKFIDACYGA